MNERELIDYLRRRFDTPPNLVSSWMGEDCEAIDIGDSNRYLLTSVDTSSEKADFPSQAPPFEMGYFSAALSLGDIAACGGKPLGILVSCSIPPYFAGRMEPVYEGINRAAYDAGASMLGGDTNSGAELSLTIVSLGFVERDKFLRRKTAQVGDLVGLTGELGRFNLGEFQYRTGGNIDYELMLRQKAPIKAGRILAESSVVTSCIDLPDGLSKALFDNIPEYLGVFIDDSAIPVDKYRGVLGERAKGFTNFSLAASPAGDIELLFTVSEAGRDMLEASMGKENIKVSWIGRVDNQPGVRLLTGGVVVTPVVEGFMHSFEGKQLFQ